MSKFNFKWFNVCFYEAIHTVYFPFIYFVINWMCIFHNATVPRGFLSLPMLSRCTLLDIARAAPSCTSDDQRRTRVIPMLRQGIGTSRKISMHALKFSPDVSTPNTIGDSRRTFGDVHQGQKCPRHIGDTSATHRRCSCKHRRCISM